MRLYPTWPPLTKGREKGGITAHGQGWRRYERRRRKMHRRDVSRPSCQSLIHAWQPFRQGQDIIQDQVLNVSVHAFEIAARLLVNG